MSPCHCDLAQGSNSGRYHTFVKYYLTRDLSSVHIESMAAPRAGMHEGIFMYIGSGYGFTISMVMTVPVTPVGGLDIPFACRFIYVVVKVLIPFH